MRRTIAAILLACGATDARASAGRRRSKPSACSRACRRASITVRSEWHLIVQVFGDAGFRLRGVGVLRLRGEAEEFSLLAFLDPSRQPVFDAVDGDLTAIVAVGVFLLVVVAEQDAAVVVLLGHDLILSGLAPND